MSSDHSHLRYIAAPMVDQSDLPWRLLTTKYGATCTYTQMYQPHFLADPQALEELQLSLRAGRSDPRNQDVNGKHKPQIVQLAGRNAQELVETARKLVDYADGFDLNLGCPQRHAAQAGIGAYQLLTSSDISLTSAIISSLSHSLPLPVSIKMRLAPNEADTSALALRLARSGASSVVLHARHTSAKARRRGPARLEVVKDVVRAFKEGMEGAAVISNGNVRTLDDVHKNLAYTGANGAMIGEALLEDPSLFHSSVCTLSSPTQLDIALEYTGMCLEPDLFSAVPKLKYIKQHLRYMLSSDRLYPPSRKRADLLRAVDSAQDVKALVYIIEREKML